MKPELFEHHKLTVQIPNEDPKTKTQRPWIEVCSTYFLEKPRWLEQILLIYGNTITSQALVLKDFHFELEYRWPWNRREEFFGQVLGVNWIDRPAICIYVPASTHGMEVEGEPDAEEDDRLDLPHLLVGLGMDAVDPDYRREIEDAAL